MSRQLMIPTADTQLYAVDTPGGTPPLLFLGGGFGTVRTGTASSSASPGSTARCDSTRGRAGSQGHRPTTPCRAAVDDIGRVIEATGIERPILVGWSYGATIAVRYARTALRAGRRDGADRRRVPDRHVRRGRQGEGPRAVPPAGVDHAHPGGARPLGADVSRRVRGRRDRDGRRQRRARARLRGAGNARPCSSSAPAPTRAPPRRRCARCALPPPRPRRATSACPCSRRRPTSTRRSSSKAPDTVVAAIEDVIHQSSRSAFDHDPRGPAEA